MEEPDKPVIPDSSYLLALINTLELTTLCHAATVKNVVQKITSLGPMARLSLP